MGSALPARDISVTDHRWSCGRCWRRHRPGSACAPIGVWLVAGGAALVVDLAAERQKRAQR